MTRLVLEVGDDRIEVDPAIGGRVTSAVLGGRERLVIAPPDEAPPGLEHVQWGMFLMVPWAGRIARGLVAWGDESFEVATGLAPGGHALHGLGVTAPWEVVDTQPHQVELALDLDRDGWRLGGRAHHRLQLAPNELTSTITCVAGDRPMPVWVGWHPCFARPEDGDLRLRLDAPATVVTEKTVPTGGTAPVAGDRDLRDGPTLGDRRLDTAYVDVTFPVQLAWPDLALQIHADPQVRTAVVYSPAHQVCVEPQTAWPDALRLQQAGVAGTGPTHLAPGEDLTVMMTWRWSTTARRSPT